jgi:hypothetical protein
MGGSTMRHRPGNIGVRCRSSAVHKVLVEATRTTSEIMVAQMEAMVSATREIETNRLALHMNLFAQNMQYQ